MLDKDKYLGALVGLAVGDALGAPIEWKKKFRPVAGMRINKRQIGSRFGETKKAGHHTDDTSMALCLAESLIKTEKFDPTDQLTRYCMWMDKGHMSSNGKCEGMGKTTREALNVFKVCGHEYTKVHNPSIAGNGSIMRLAPIPMMYAHDEVLTRFWSGQSSKTTHAHVQCVEACTVLGVMISRALNGKSKEEILDFTPTPIVFSGVDITIEDVVARKTYLKEPPYIKGTGHVVKSLEAALWAFEKSTSFKHGALLAVNLGEDADTTGAIYGQLAGAYYGYKKIPKAWRDKLIKRDLIEKHALGLYKLADVKAKERKNSKKITIRTPIRGTGRGRGGRGC